MSILSGRAIAAAIERGDIKVDPFDPRMLNPASIDLTLGDRALVYDVGEFAVDRLLDAHEKPPTIGARSHQGGAFLLYPRRGYLLKTEVCLPKAQQNAPRSKPRVRAQLG